VAAAAGAPSDALTLEKLADVVDARSRHFRRNLAIVGAASLLVGGGLAAAGFAIAAANTGGATPTTVALSAVAVEQRDVSVYTDFAGTLGYGDTLTVNSAAAGVVTAVPVAGTDLKRGDVLFSVNSQPVVLLYGALPIWRSLNSSSTAGPDILQLETNLAALGYTADGHMTVDTHFTYYTGVALKAWETAMGFPTPSTTFDSSAAIYLPGTVRVDSAVTRGTVATKATQVLSVAVTGDVTDAVVSDHGVSSTSVPTQQVALQVTTTDQSLFTNGLAVQVELADTTTIAGTVTSVGTTVKRSGSGPNATLYVDVSVAIPNEPAGGLIQGPVTVHVPSQSAKQAIMVPVRALVALAEGGYAVQVQTASGTLNYVGVTTGLFSDGWVQVTGKVAAGDKVMVPA
jgi:hypothetical protein